jgi:lysophospholipase L1-like esterase
MKKIILGFGASSMQGVGDSAGGFFKRLENLVHKQNPNTRFLNQGIGGNTTVDMLNRLGEAISAKANVTIVLLGCNDLPRTPDSTPKRRTDLTTYRTNLDALFSKLKTDPCLFVTSFAPQFQQTGIKPDLFSQYMNEAISSAKKADWPIWDLYRESLSWPSSFYAPDGIHASDAAHEQIAQSLFTQLQAVF